MTVLLDDMPVSMGAHVYAHEHNGTLCNTRVLEDSLKNATYILTNTY
ncbi:MAG: Uncharacterised protein [Candidatus Poseidoniaceae archaeon]|nr:MAG: Uncharacterised protein [Candidatus Poseidoniaceae archaeon]